MAEFPADWIRPRWPVSASVHAVVTTRTGGASAGPYASMNLGTAVGDDPEAVARNRARLASLLPSEPRWLTQVHGTTVVDAHSVTAPLEADASFTRVHGVVSAVLIADCLPILITDREGRLAAAVHAGWRGLVGGVVENTVAALDMDPSRLLAWLGPAIGPQKFEVGADVFDAFLSRAPETAPAFRPIGPSKWLADLFWLARRQLTAAGVGSIQGGGLCTYSDPIRFFSHRRDRVTGRMAALIWLES